MKNSCRSPRCHFTPRNVKGSYQHGKRCQSPTRQRQSRNNQTPNQRNNFHHRDVSPEAESIPFQKPHSGAVLEPVYLKFEPFEPFPDEDSRHEPIVKDASDKSSVATSNHLKRKLMKTLQILRNQAPKLSTGSGNLFLDQMVAARMSTITRKDVLKD
ncbi:hypothetical protein TNCT_257521 [Trichonephila clavata]|uniref:Uncharacterized protein n=1 Tax=Trichonephila clavata TaxID=2740835 RepID=A0A8X6L4F8_TRICU|nr:hypothetical protein TNCT_257521 [Trichonephila clavata]